MGRLRRSDCSGPGIARRRRGRGFEYLGEDGARIEDEEVLARIRELAIPPAWREVWICPYPMGHLQATGVDAAGRKQYLYHSRWRERMDQRKFDEMLEFARALPAIRRKVRKGLARPAMDRTRILSCAVRLLDRGFFRIGSEGYAEQNNTFGLATMRKSHVTVHGDGSIVFDFPAKGGIRRVQGLADPHVHEVVRALRRRRGGGEELLAWKDGRRWRDVRSDDINAFLRELSGAEYSAKDFRTWNATVLAAVALGASAHAAGGSKAARRRARTRAIEEVARYLGNTPAVARASYIDPRVFDRFDSGWTIAPVLPDAADLTDSKMRAKVEAAVLDLIEDHRRSDAVERGAEGLPEAA